MRKDHLFEDMDKSLKDQFLDFTLPPFPSGPEQILWAHALRNLINKNTALEPVSTQISPLLCPPFLLPPSPCFPSTPAFFCPESCHRSLHLPATSTGCKEAEMFEFAAAVKRRRLHLGITQVSLKIFLTTHLIWESKHSKQRVCYFLFPVREKAFVEQGGLCDVLDSLYQQTISQTTLSR